ncbi:MAG TPA: hypothetical protein VK597_10365 [Inquilinus sp.]|nr:hypothetical protein [Inquilinus sp.]
MLPPASYRGDYYVDEFTDAKLRPAWATCVAAGDACSAGPLAYAGPLGRRNEFRTTGTVDPFGKVDANGRVDLAKIRRPAYFAAQPYAEPIAEADPRTFVVEVTVPAEANETKYLGVPAGATWGQRGWFIRGSRGR